MNTNQPTIDAVLFELGDRRLLDGVDTDLHQEIGSAVARSAITAYLAALSQEPSSASMGVVVKALEWVETFREGDYFRLEAETSFGIYRVSNSFVTLTSKGFRDVPAAWRGPVPSAEEHAASVDAAKAAAQADFEHRVRSCLSPAPVQEAVAWQERYRSRTDSQSQWNDWSVWMHRAKGPPATDMNDETYQVEYRPLYAAPQAPGVSGVMVEAVKFGWLYFNEDAGTEWSENHPVDSGEVPDATDIRPCTEEARYWIDELRKRDEELSSLRAALEAAIAQAPAGGEWREPDKWRSKFNLWFFRDLSDEQRLTLFSLHELPVDEIGRVHGFQRKALNRCLPAYEGSPAKEERS